MSCDLTREQLIAHLYGEDTHADERERLKVHIETCPSCSQTLEELGATSRMLNAWCDEVPNMDIVFVEARPSFWQRLLPARPAKRWAVGAASALAAILVTTFLNVEFAIRDGAFHAAIGLRSSDPAEQVDTSETLPLDASITRGEFIAYQQDLIDYTHRLVHASQNQQRDEVNSTFIRLVSEIETQRQQDLQRIDRGLQILYNKQEIRLNHILQQIPFERVSAAANQPTRMIPTRGKTP